jgi:hypothetical protein
MSTKPTTKTPPSPERSLDAARSVVQAAERVLADLQGRRGAMLARSSALDQERKRASFGAYTLDGDGARLLDQLRDQMAALDAEITDIGNAIEVATMRVADAKHALQKIENDQRLEKVVAEQAKLVAVCQRLDESLHAFTIAGRELVDVIDALYRLDHPHPNRTQIDALGFRALSTAMSGGFWAGHFQRLQPAQRVTFTQLGDAWARRSNETEQTGEAA